MPYFNDFLNEIRTNQISYGNRYLPPEYYDDIRGYYDYVKKKQGFIGKSWDAVKNKFNFKSGSKNIENSLNNLAADRYNQVNEDEAIKLVNKYAKSQFTSSVVTRNICASSLASLGLIITKKVTKNMKSANAPYLIGGAVAVVCGMLGAVAIKAIDAKSAKRKYEKGEMRNDIYQGAIQGAISGLLPIGTADMTEGKGKLFKFLTNRVVKNLFKLLGRFATIAGEVEKNIIMKVFKKVLHINDKKLEERLENSINAAIKGKKTNQDYEKYEKYEYFDPREQKAA